MFNEFTLNSNAKNATHVAEVKRIQNTEEMS